MGLRNDSGLGASLQPLGRGRDVRLGEGVATVRAYLQAGLVDETHLAVATVFLARGEHLFAGLDLPSLGPQAIEHASSDGAMHVVFRQALSAGRDLLESSAIGRHLAGPATHVGRRPDQKHRN